MTDGWGRKRGGRRVSHGLAIFTLDTVNSVNLFSLSAVWLNESAGRR